MITTRRLATLALFLFLALPSPLNLHAENLKAHAEPIPAAGTVEVFFSPEPGGAEAAIVRELDGAHKEILIQAYSFTNKRIARAIIEAKKRGLKIEAVLDKSNVTGKYSAAIFLSNAGVPVLIDSAHAIAHNKIMILDRQTIITGSYNFTAAAEKKNSENLLIIRGNPALASHYLINFDLHERHSEPFSR